MRTTLRLAVLAVLHPAILGAQAFAALSPAVQRLVSVSAPTVALTHVRVIDGTGGPIQEDMTVLIDKGRIAAVGKHVAIPASAEVRDLSGHTVIPGLIGMHDHTFYTLIDRAVPLPFSAPRLYLGSGVTTIRTTGSFAPYEEMNMKAAIDAGTSPGPRMHVTGPYLTGTSGRGEMRRLKSAEEAARTVRYWTEEGATWIKVYTSITREQLRAVVAEARKHGTKVTGHLCSISYREAIELGMDNVEHSFMASSDFSRSKKPGECPADMDKSLREVPIDGPEVQRVIDMLVAAKMPVTSTNAVYEVAVAGRGVVDDRMRKALAPHVLPVYQSMRTMFDTMGTSYEAYFRKSVEFDRRFFKAGGLLAAGVDATGAGGALPGFGDQRNFGIFVEGGFTPAEAMQVMTLNGARILGVDKDLGSVTAGKIADLVVLRGDPASRPDDMRNVSIVFKDGVGYDAQKIIDSVNGRVGIR
ncbi:MAG: amidohydrolase, imidazolonepropionase [Gemmatimonadetes bacterium]|jgi:imidazolonepropionase-like amidohydrolase|nr:amidohydrolase, imidazolonepropionase [Gemmatimonadota bacterium]